MPGEGGFPRSPFLRCNHDRVQGSSDLSASNVRKSDFGGMKMAMKDLFKYSDHLTRRVVGKGGGNSRGLYPPTKLPIIGRIRQALSIP